MSRKFFLCAVVAIASSGAGAQMINAKSCSQSDVQSALKSVAANGTTVVIPSGSCSWTGNLNFSTPYSFTLQGQSAVTASDSHGNPTAFKDSTNITDGQPGTGGNSAILSISLTGNSGQVVRMTGITFHGGNAEYNGDIVLDGDKGQARVDHNHFINEANLALSMYEPMTGVADHNLFDVPAGNLWNGIRVYNTGGDGYGDAPWAAAPGYGTNNFIFIENNTFNNGYVNDCEDGGAYVARYNTLNVTTANQNIGIQGHATGSQPRGRGCRAWEAYGNWAGGGGGTIQYTVGFQTSGSGLWWGNTISNSNFDLVLVEDRDSTETYRQTAAPNGWGYCGSAQSGSLSKWDGNQSSGGYPCLDQVGRGKGDLLTGYWPDVQDSAKGGVAWPQQALEPVYVWMENFSGSTPVLVTSPNNNIQANRDYYAPVAGFNGTAGTGYGTYANIPSTCTAGPGGNTPGVGYWATDQHKLYVCTATNTWTEYYKPYAYPHPLVQPGSSTASPGSPTGLTGKVN